jgi:hypothetical protein
MLEDAALNGAVVASQRLVPIHHETKSNSRRFRANLGGGHELPAPGHVRVQVRRNLAIAVTTVSCLTSGGMAPGSGTAPCPSLDAKTGPERYLISGIVQSLPVTTADLLALHLE